MSSGGRWQTEPRGLRPPGNLPNVLSKLEECRQTLNAAPKGLQPQFHAVLTALENLARVQDDFNRREWDRYNSLPAKHGKTHMGGSDNIWNNDTPSEVALNGEGDPGNGREGFSAHDHVHALTIGEGELTPSQIEGEPDPPFSTLKVQLGWLDAQAVREYGYRPILCRTWR